MCVWARVCCGENVVALVVRPIKNSFVFRFLSAFLVVFGGFGFFFGVFLWFVQFFFCVFWRGAAPVKPPKFLAQSQAEQRQGG